MNEIITKLNEIEEKAVTFLLVAKEDADGSRAAFFLLRREWGKAGGGNHAAHSKIGEGE